MSTARSTWNSKKGRKVLLHGFTGPKAPIMNGRIGIVLGCDRGDHGKFPWVAVMITTKPDGNPTGHFQWHVAANNLKLVKE